MRNFLKNSHINGLFKKIRNLYMIILYGERSLKTIVNDKIIGPKDKLELENIISINLKHHPSHQNKFGIELATKVADKIFSNQGNLCFQHRDYCGQGIFYDDKSKKVNLSSVYDGYEVDVIKKWDINSTGKQNFISWLSEQSDFSLSGCFENLFYEKDTFYRNNQRISKSRLEGYVDIDINKKHKL